MIGEPRREAGLSPFTDAFLTIDRLSSADLALKKGPAFESP
jgi:hypothetical protein